MGGFGPYFSPRDPDFPWARVYYARCLEQLGLKDEMIRELETARDLYEHPMILGRLGYAYGVVGRRDEAEKILSDLGIAAEDQYISPHYIAWIYHGLGNRDETFRFLEKAVEDRSPTMFLLRADPVWDSVRDDHRFVAVLEQIGLAAF